MRHRAVVLLLLAFVPTAAHSDWEWRYPSPQGHALNDVVFLTPTNAIAVGEFGTVLLSQDAGLTWTLEYQVEGIETPLKVVERIDATTAIAIGENGLILRTVNSGADWATIPSPSSNLFDISFADANHGIIAAGNTMLRTSDGGFVWESSSVAVSMIAVDAVTPSVIFACGWQSVMTSTDGGETWTPVTSPVPPTFDGGWLTAIDFIDALNGVVANQTGYGGVETLLPQWHVTTDGGVTWNSTTVMLTPDANTPNEILYVAPGQFFAGYTMTCCITSTYDLWPWGSVFVANGAPPVERPMVRSANGLASNDNGVVLAVGEDGMIMRSTGTAFARIGGVVHKHHVEQSTASSFADPLNGVVISSDSYMYPISGVHQTHFARTADGGLTWGGVMVNNVQMVDLAHMSASDIYAVGYGATQGKVLRSTNGGASWTTVLTDASFTVGTIEAGSPTHAVAAATGGRVLVIDNGTITPVLTGVSNFRDIAFATPSIVVGVSDGTTNGRSIDGGLTWSPMPAPSPRVRELDFATPSIAFGITTSGIVRSDDGGTNWTPVPSGAYTGLMNIDFGDADHGAAVGRDGLVLITIDGGVTWTPEVPPTRRDFYDVAAFANGSAFVSGPQQITLEYFVHAVPTLISSFDVAAQPFAAELRWNVSDDGNLSSFSIVRRHGAREETVASGVARAARSFIDKGLIPGESYEYQLVAIDQDGATMLSAPMSVTIPRAVLELLPNQPNPFNPSTRVGFVLPAKEHVTLQVFDATGRLVITLLNGVRDPGIHYVDWNAEGAASGVYFGRLQAGKQSASRKMVLLK